SRHPSERQRHWCFAGDQGTPTSPCPWPFRLGLAVQNLMAEPDTFPDSPILRSLEIISCSGVPITGKKRVDQKRISTLSTSERARGLDRGPRRCNVSQSEEA